MTKSNQHTAEVRWEHGSEFHWPDIPSSTDVDAPWAGGGALFGSGRDALRALLEHGRAHFGWQRLWMPSYFCQEVVAAAKMSMQVSAYADAPGSIPNFGDVQVKPGDVVFIANYFGLRSSIDSPTGAAIVEDHTHDPWSEWSRGSAADFCLASLRKTLPVPDGGVVWSPRQHTLPPIRPVAPERALASSNKTAGMLLKRLYLEGGRISKDTFRALLLAGEGQIASGAISGMPPFTEALLGALPTPEWRRQRRRNHQAFVERFQSGNATRLQVLQPDGNADMAPFSVVLLVDRAERREAIREALIRNRIYPAVLWPLQTLELEGVPGAHVDLSRRMLSLHCDFRYTDADILRIADAVLAAEEQAA